MRASSIGKRLRQTPMPKSRFCEHISNDDDQSFSCRQRIYVTCPHCQRSLCLYHINEHQILIRNLFDSLVNRLNEYRYELTVTLSIPSSIQTIVNNCLDEFQNIIIPYVQRTCCQNDVKQEDVNRIQIFIDKMSTIVQHIHFYWDNRTSSDELEETKSKKRIRTNSDDTIAIEMKRGFTVTLIWQILSFTAFVLNLTANSSDRWWVHAREGGEHTFVRAGLWQVCFNMYRHRFDYYGKIYHGCWWLFSPEVRLLRSWITNNWLRWVQTLSTLSLIMAFFALITSLLVLRDKQGFKYPKQVLTATLLHGIAGVLMFATVIMFGINGKRRDWMMNWQFNWFGWSFQLAIVACILHLATAFISGYQGMNKFLYETFDYERAHGELEDRSTLKVSTSPKRRNPRHHADL